MAEKGTLVTPSGEGGAGGEMEHLLHPAGCSESADWLTPCVASALERGSLEDTPLSWEGIHSLGDCLEKPSYRHQLSTRYRLLEQNNLASRGHPSTARLCSN